MRPAAGLAPESIEALAAGPGSNLVQIGAPDVWAAGFTGQGVVVAGADTGYDWTHPALKGKYRGWNGTTADHNYNWHDAIHSAPRKSLQVRREGALRRRRARHPHDGNDGG